MVNVLRTIFDQLVGYFAEYVRDKRGRERKLSPFFRFTLAWDCLDTPTGTKFKGMAFVIVSSQKYLLPRKSSQIKSKLATFLARELESDVGFGWEIRKEGFEKEQISANELSGAWLYRMYAFNNDRKIGEESLY